LPLILFMTSETQVERKICSILKVLSTSKQALGSRVIARNMTDLGVDLSERAVRYHLKLMDERGLTRLVGRRDGREITDQGLTELRRALVSDKVGLAFSRIETLAFCTDYNWTERSGTIPVNVSFFSKKDFGKALKIMRPIFQAGLCVSKLVTVAEEGETIGEISVPEGKKALATVCSIAVNGALLKAGIPVDSRFGGILQIKKYKPMRFTELIHYSGSSLDPSEIFIRANMTSVTKAAENGDGEILANFREIPAVCRNLAEEVGARLKDAGIGGLFFIGNVSETVCEIPIDLNRIGVVLIGGLNPVAAAREAGIESDNHSMSALIDYRQLVPFEEIINL
jgi:repressor of nif and glnA expression